jgi:hypothetical protein
MPMAHACNPSYLGGRDQKDHSSKPAWANRLRDSISKISITKKAGGVAQSVGPEFKPQYPSPRKKKFAKREKRGEKGRKKEGRKEILMNFCVHMSL